MLVKARFPQGWSELVDYPFGFCIRVRKVVGCQKAVIRSGKECKTGREMGTRLEWESCPSPNGMGPCGKANPPIGMLLGSVRKIPHTEETWRKHSSRAEPVQSAQKLA